MNGLFLVSAAIAKGWENDKLYPLTVPLRRLCVRVRAYVNACVLLYELYVSMRLCEYVAE